MGHDLDAELAFDAALDSSVFDGLSGVTRAIHLCRGNLPGGNWYRSGGYAAIAAELFPALDVDVMLLEFDSDRAGDFAPLRHIRPDTICVLGLLTTKNDVLEEDSASTPPQHPGRGSAIMAEIVIGVASSHTPQLSSGADMWPDHAERDRRNPTLLGLDAEYHTYDELLEIADPNIEHELTEQVWAAKYQRCQDALAVLAERLASANPDIAIVFGDDQRELFRDEGIPAFGCFLGDQLIDRPLDSEQRARTPKGILAASWAAHASTQQTHATCPELSSRVLSLLTEHDFDVMQFSQQGEDRSLGHAFTFPRYRLGLSSRTRITPIFINTYYQPNVPSASRCCALGEVVRKAVESWDSDARVAIVASGGLSHFVVDEKLDRQVLASLERHDREALGSLSRKQLRSGTSEILNWIAAAGALGGMRTTVVDYIPGYRSPAGTGAGMAFTYWERG